MYEVRPGSRLYDACNHMCFIYQLLYLLEALQAASPVALTYSR